jgi:hypothetical protein
MFAALSIQLLADKNYVQIGTAALGSLVALWHAIHATRILHRVYFVCENRKHAGLSKFIREFFSSIPCEVSQQFAGRDKKCASRPIESTMTWLDLIQMLGIGLAGIGITVQCFYWNSSQATAPSLLLVGTTSLGMVVTGTMLCLRRIQSWKFGLPITISRSLATQVCIASKSGEAPLATSFLAMKPGQCNQKATVHSVERDLIRHDVTNRSTDFRSKHANWTGTHLILAVSASIVAALSLFVVWNPNAAKSLPQSLAAIQTLMLGWIVYRLATYRRFEDQSVVRFIAMLVVIACFVLNSGVCVANCL